jgi:hypothetical protein
MTAGAKHLDVVWRGSSGDSLEYCSFTEESGGIASSTIVGVHEGFPYLVRYTVITDQAWRTLSAEVECHYRGHIRHHHFESDGGGKWLCDGEPDPRFDGCLDVDIAVTPFTNTLAVRRLQLAPGDVRVISVVYFDLLEMEIGALRQKYTCIDARTYHYENVPRDFEARITVDECGLVTHYPSLFQRIATQQL